jgi:hypothetical protein
LGQKRHAIAEDSPAAVTRGVGRQRRQKRVVIIGGMRTPHVLVALGAAFVTACGLSGEATEPPKTPETQSEPNRTAADSGGVRKLLLDLATHNLCSSTKGELIALYEDGASEGPERGSAPVIGRNWIEVCEATKKGEQVDVRLSGRGWTWVSKSSTKLGAQFDVSQYVAFKSDISLLAAVDLSYAKEQHIVSLWLSPIQPVDARVVPTSKPHVDRKGAWSELLGGVSALAGSSPEKQAGKQVAKQGSANTRHNLRHGFTVSVELCTGQRDVVDTALDDGVTPQRPFKPGGHIWLKNERVRLMPGGLDASGTFDTDRKAIGVDIEVEKGQGVRASLICVPEADRVITAFLKGAPLPSVRELAERAVKPGPAQTLEAPGECPTLLVVRPSDGAKDPVEYRYMVYEKGDSHKPLVLCR